MEGSFGKNLAVLVCVAGIEGGCVNGVENDLHNSYQNPSAGHSSGYFFDNLVDACTSLNESDCPVYSGTDKSDSSCVSRLVPIYDSYIRRIVDSAVLQTGDDSVTFDDIRNGDVPSNALIHRQISYGTDGDLESIHDMGSVYVTFDVEDEVVGSNGFWCQFERVQFVGDDSFIPNIVSTGYYYDYSGYPDIKNPEDHIVLVHIGGVFYDDIDPTTVHIPSVDGSYSESLGYDTSDTVGVIGSVTSRISGIVETFLPITDLPRSGDETMVSFGE